MKQRIPGLGLVTAVAGLVTMANVALLAPAAGAAQADQSTKKSDVKKTVKFVGSSESKTYHKPSCKFAKQISKDHLVQFASAAQAKKAGYTPCKVCLPEKATSQPTTDTGTGSAGKTDTKAKTGQ